MFGLFHIFTGETVSFMTTLTQVVQNKLYQALMIAGAVFNLRLILVRLRDRDLSK
jgi:hypothetical protein